MDNECCKKCKRPMVRVEGIRSGVRFVEYLCYNCHTDRVYVDRAKPKRPAKDSEKGGHR